MRSVRNEADLLPRRIDQSEPALRIQYGQRQTGEPGSGAYVGNRGALQEIVDGQTVEKMMGNHLPAIFYGRQVISAVPSFQLVQKLLELHRIALGECDSQTFCALRQAVGHGQGNLAREFAAILSLCACCSSKMMP